LKENLLWVKTFDTIEELRAALIEFATRYNETWLVARHGYRTPAQVRADQCRLDPNATGWPPEHGHLRALQPLLAVEFLVANDGGVASPVKAVSRRRRGPQARLYRTCYPAILGHRGRRLAT